MLKKFAVQLGIFIALVLLVIATMVYPGGSLSDKNAVGFDWSKNFISNLFGEKSVNGAPNPSRIWADTGMMFLAASFALFFIRFSKKIPAKGPAQIVRYLGVGGMLFTFLIVTPLHDIMVNLSSTLFLVSIFYITVFIFKSRLHLFKFLCTGCLLVFYYTLYLYGSGSYLWLPVMQKITFLSVVILIVGLDLFTKEADFTNKQPAG
ncbi:MAG: hypothetical protein RLZZ28_440 [Bacteroidota bacterium]|jgi:hypothetical protein